VWVSVFFLVKKIPKGRQEKKSDFFIPKFPKIQTFSDNSCDEIS
jgi:hypothetical protein